MSDEIKDLGESSLESGTSDVVNRVDSMLQNDFHAKSVDDAESLNGDRNKLFGDSIETFKEIVTKQKESAAPNGKHLESLKNNDKASSNVHLVNEKSVENLKTLFLDNLGTLHNFKALFAHKQQIFATSQSKIAAQKKLSAKHSSSVKEGKIGETSKDLLLQYGKTFLSENINSELVSPTVANSVTQTPTNITILEEMRDLMGYEGIISDFAMLDSFDWLDEVWSVESRARRASEPYHYRRFQQPIRAYIPENSPRSTKVIEIPRNFEGTLEIVHPENPIFRFRNESGILETTQTLDFEMVKEYKLIIRDSNSNDSSFYNHDVIVYVTDVNDNEPRFAMTSFSADVNMASRVGSFVTQLNATDPDSRERGRLGFMIGNRNSIFTVNPRTWVMETNGKPLATSQSSFPTNLRVFDQGYPRMESPTSVIDVNKANNPPKFDQSEYTFTYSESLLPGVAIGRVMALSLSNIPIGYEVVLNSDVFMINQRGELSLKRSINFETVGSQLTKVISIRASELTDSNPLSSQVSVTLVVTNYNEYPTVFSETIYTAQIDENVGIGTFVTSVRATDCDCGVDCRCTENEVDFALMNDEGYFEITNAGEIRTAKDFDYDFQNVHEFGVMAWDRTANLGGMEPARAYVSVKLRNVNNNAPKFTKNRYRFLVDEDSEIDHLVGVVQATDKDSLDSHLTYSITESSPRAGLFRIPDARFGILVVASSLKTETESTFVLTIQASDGEQSSQTIVEVHRLLLAVLSLCL